MIPNDTKRIDKQINLAAPLRFLDASVIIEKMIATNAIATPATVNAKAKFNPCLLKIKNIAPQITANMAIIAGIMHM